MGMAQSSTIAWTETTWNPLAGCTWASPGCDNCYAAVMTRRLESMGQVKYAGLTTRKHFNGKIRIDEDSLTIPMKWKRPRLIFANSMSDLFHRDVPFEFVDKVFAVMALTPQHTYQVLTKRPERMAEYFEDVDELRRRIGAAAGCLLDGDWIWNEGKKFRPAIENLIDESIGLRCHDDGSEGQIPELELPLSNVHLGASVEDQKRADDRIRHLLKCPAAVRFLSIEPMLGRIDLFRSLKWQQEYYCISCRNWFGHCALENHCPNCGHEHHDELCPECGEEEYELICPECGLDGGNGGLSHVDCCDREIEHAHGLGVDWVIVGGESGPGSRPYRLDWDLNIEQQCKQAGVRFFRKQLGRHPWLPYYFENDEIREWALGRPHRILRPVGGGLVEWDHQTFGQPDPKSMIEIRLQDKKGENWMEWPESLRTREWPRAE